MAVRKASAYSSKTVRPYTRKSKAKAKAYIKMVPNNKIVKYTGGNAQMYNGGKLPYVVRCVTEEKIQIRDLALEACRQFLTKAYDTNLPGRYYMMVKVYPHHIQRNNKTAAGAGADRISTGMTQSFGVTEGRAAIVGAGNNLFVVHCSNENDARVARDALDKIRAKLPGRNRVIIEKPVSQ